MRFTSTQFKALILTSIALTSFFAFLQIFCFSRQIFRSERPCISAEPILRNWKSKEENRVPWIHIVTPTYRRPAQKADLTRLSYTLMLVPRINWIVVEDSANRSRLVTNFVKRLFTLNPSMRVVHLNVETPKKYKTKLSDPNWLKPRGVLQRNEGLNWLALNYKSFGNDGVVYFADDDNTYDIRLFEEMRQTQKVSIWPVGLAGGLMVEKPILSSVGKVTGWNTLWKPDRPYAIDMAGFAVNLKLILTHADAKFNLKVPRGYQESHFLQRLIAGLDQLEPRCNNCTSVYVWHTRTETVKLDQESKLQVPSNFQMEV